MLLDRAVRNRGCNAGGVPGFSRIKRHAQFLAISGAKGRSAKALPARPRALQTCFGPLADLLSLQLGEGGQNGEQHIAD
jgi:hypothetical protein